MNSMIHANWPRERVGCCAALSLAPPPAKRLSGRRNASPLLAAPHPQLDERRDQEARRADEPRPERERLALGRAAQARDGREQEEERADLVEDRDDEPEVGGRLAPRAAELLAPVVVPEPSAEPATNRSAPAGRGAPIRAPPRPSAAAARAAAALRRAPLEERDARVHVERERAEREREVAPVALGRRAASIARNHFGCSRPTLTMW